MVVFGKKFKCNDLGSLYYVYKTIVVDKKFETKSAIIDYVNQNTEVMKEALLGSLFTNSRIICNGKPMSSDFALEVIDRNKRVIPFLEQNYDWLKTFDALSVKISDLVIDQPQSLYNASEPPSSSGVPEPLCEVVESNPPNELARHAVVKKNRRRGRKHVQK